MTTNARPAKERRLLVNLSVVAGSAAMLAASWLGVASTAPTEDDGAALAAAVPVAPEVPAVSPAVASTDAIGAANLIPTPTPAPRRVIVTRQSRAS